MSSNCMSFATSAIWCCEHGKAPIQCRPLCNVQVALTDILAQHGGLSGDEAAAALAQMATEKRYVRDIWS
jgi:hypothetical protein